MTAHLYLYWSVLFACVLGNYGVAATTDYKLPEGFPDRLRKGVVTSYDKALERSVYQTFVVLIISAWEFYDRS